MLLTALQLDGDLNGSCVAHIGIGMDVDDLSRLELNVGISWLVYTQWTKILWQMIVVLRDMIMKRAVDHDLPIMRPQCYFLTDEPRNDTSIARETRLAGCGMGMILIGATASTDARGVLQLIYLISKRMTFFAVATRAVIRASFDDTLRRTRCGSL